MNVQKVILILFLFFYANKSETSTPNILTRGRYPFNGIKNVERYNNYNNRFSYHPSSKLMDANSFKTNGFSNRQMTTGFNNQKSYGQPSNARQFMSSPRMHSVNNNAKSSPLQSNAPKYGNYRYPRRKGNQYGYFSRPQGYGNYGFGSSRTQQTSGTQQSTNNQYTSRPKNQGWYTVSSSGTRHPQISSGSSFNGQTSNYQKNTPFRSQTNNNQPYRINSATGKNNNNNAWISSTNILSTPRPTNQRFRNPSNSLTTNTFRRPFPQQINKSNNNIGLNKSAQSNLNILKSSLSYSTTKRPSTVKTNGAQRVTNSLVLSTSKPILKNQTTSSINDTKDKVIKQAHSETHNLSNLKASNKNIIQIKSKENGTPGRPALAREPNLTPFLPNKETPSLFDTEAVTKKDELKATAEALGASNTYYKSTRAQNTTTTNKPIEETTTTKQELSISESKENLDPKDVEEYRLFLEWRQNNRDENNLAELGIISSTIEVPESLDNGNSKLYGTTNSSTQDASSPVSTDVDENGVYSNFDVPNPKKKKTSIPHNSAQQISQIDDSNENFTTDIPKTRGVNDDNDEESITTTPGKIDFMTAFMILGSIIN